MKRTPSARFWAKVFINEWEPNACWTWEGYRLKGHGRFGLGDSIVYAHVFAFKEAGGQLTADKPIVIHKCHEFGFADNRSCVRPMHLRAGSFSENVKDSQAAGTYCNENTYKTVCKHGHSLADAYVTKRGDRSCRTCGNISCRRYRASLRGSLGQ